MSPPIGNLSSKPWQVWLYLLVAACGVTLSIIQLVNFYVTAPISFDSASAFRFTTEVSQILFKAMVIAFSIIAIWRQQISGLIVLLLWILASLYQTVQMGFLGFTSPSSSSHVGLQSDAGFWGRWTGLLLIVLLQVVLIVIPIFSNKTRSYFRVGA